MTDVRLGERFLAAVALAARLHDGQVRKGTGVPYLSHPLGVASLVLEAGGTEDEAIAGLLHDTVEDQGGLGTLERIRAEFGDRVADIVLACSDSTVEDPSEKADWRVRKEAHLAHLASVDASTALVFAADKLHNVRSVVRDYRDQGPVLWGRFKGRRDGTLWYYRESVLALRANAAAPAALVDELNEAVTLLERLVEAELDGGIDAGAASRSAATSRPTTPSVTTR
jgi:(p)ppGpp synthase/HD superfamily hydrolase